MSEEEDYKAYVQQMLLPVKDAIGAFDRMELLKSAGGLQLIPENATHQIRLEALAHIAASLPNSKTGVVPTAHRLRTVLNSGALEGQPIGTAEDPCDNPFTEEITFYGGSFLTIPGRGEETVFIVRQLASALFLHPDPIQHREFMAAARAVLGAALVLADVVSRKAGLNRGIAPVFHRDAKVPASQELERLKNAVYFSNSELKTIFSSKGYTLTGLAPLICPAQTDTLSSYRIDNGTLLTRPVISNERGTVVAIPGGLMAAAINAVISFAQQFGVASELAEKFADMTWHSIQESLRRLDSHPISVRLPPAPEVLCFHDALFSLDTDKVTYVLSICDPLEGYDAGVFVQDWKIPSLNALIEQRTSEIATFVSSWPKPPNDVLCLIIPQSPGRSFLMGFNQEEIPSCGPMLSLTAADLDTLTQLDDNEPLKLWKFARAHRKVADRVERMISTGVLNEYAVYKQRDHSFYFSDEARPTLMVFPPGSAGDLRREAANSVDLHGVLSYDTPGAVVDVGTLFGARDIPLYVELRNAGRRPVLLVEAYDLPVWVVGPAPNEKEEFPMFSEHARFVDALSYWIWQIAPSLSEIISSESLSLDQLVIHVKLLLHESWARVDVQFPNPNLPPVTVTNADDSLDVLIHPHISTLLRRGDNAGERVIVESTLRGLRELLPAGSAKLSDPVIQAILDKHVPLGIKKRLFALTSETAPIQRSDGLPDSRPLQEADEQEVLDDLGDMLIETDRLSTGNIPREKQNSVANRAVTLLYGEFERIIANLNADHLLEWLIAHHERLLVAQDYHEMNLPTRLACFGPKSKALDDFLGGEPRRAATATAARFVIEYVAVRPPHGDRPISLCVYDRLQALASHIINLGFVSDLIRYELSSVEVKILPSRRIAFTKKEYDKAIGFFQSATAPDKISAAHELFSKRFDTATSQTPAQQNELFAELNEALKAECGFSFDEVIDFGSCASALGWERSTSGVVAIETGDFTSVISSRLNWPVDRVQECVDLLSLKRRDNFLEPESPFTKEDVYPWRYNRPLAYLRRPFLRRQIGNGEQLVWGSRQVLTSINFLAHLCSSGRFRAKTLAMKQFLSKLNNQRGGRFNKTVGAYFKQSSRFKVKENVKKISGLVGLREIGEIDVLFADTKEFHLCVCECKDLAAARTPHELALELDSLFVGVGGKEAIITKLARKEKWVSSHLDHVLKWMGVEKSAQKWNCQAVVVADREMITPRLRRSDIRILSFKKLKKIYE